MEGFEEAFFTKLLELLVLLDAILILSENRPQTIVRLYSEVSCDQVDSLWFGAYSADV